MGLRKLRLLRSGSGVLLDDARRRQVGALPEGQHGPQRVARRQVHARQPLRGDIVFCSTPLPPFAQAPWSVVSIKAPPIPTSQVRGG